PVVLVGLVAAFALVPESRAQQRPGLDPVGVVASTAGLVGVTYGLIETGQNGWGDTSALVPMIAGLAVLVGFVLWEYWLGRRPGGQPLLDLTLFRSASFTWGTILTTMVSFALFGILFAMPQYFQEVKGVNAFGSGLRLLPMIGGMVLGMLVGTRLQTAPKSRDGAPPAAPRVSARALVAVGFAVMGVALAVGATTSTHSGTFFAAAWFAAAGVGLGFAMPAAMNAALGALSAQRSGAGSALISAMRQVGATIGVAVLGTVLLSAYRSRLGLTRRAGGGQPGCAR
ncbi:MAG TPA: hypothetical protein VK162_19115, partial [Streptosporangiaceae bacterium]|nr:hypothetical protein [Streptosporangiaceae bacterium]